MMPGLHNVDGRQLPKPGSAEWHDWRASGLRIDEWVTKRAQTAAAMPRQDAPPARQQAAMVENGSGDQERVRIDPEPTSRESEAWEIPTVRPEPPPLNWQDAPLYGEQAFGLREPVERETDVWTEGRE